MDEMTHKPVLELGDKFSIGNDPRVFTMTELYEHKPGIFTDVAQYEGDAGDETN